MSSPSRSRWVLVVAAVLALLPLAVALAVTWQVEPPTAAASGNLGRAVFAGAVLLAILLGGALALLFLALAETAAGGPPSLETSWGGFGGGLGGWHLSPALTYLLLALLLGGLFGVLANRVVGSSAFQAWAAVNAADAGSAETETTGAQAEGAEGGATNAADDTESPGQEPTTEPPTAPDTTTEG